MYIVDDFEKESVVLPFAENMEKRTSLLRSKEDLITKHEY